MATNGSARSAAGLRSWSCTAIRPAAGIAVLLLVGVSVVGDSSRAGLLTGLSIAAPLGPVGLLCMRRTLTDGPTAGFVAGLGAATVHLLYAALASLGLAGLTGALQEGRAILNLVGGLVLAVLAIRAAAGTTTDDHGDAGWPGSGAGIPIHSGRDSEQSVDVACLCSHCDFRSGHIWSR